MTFCANCGTQLSPGVRFCANCGAAVPGAPASAPPAFGASPYGTPSAPPAYGTPSAPPAYGTPSAPPAYGVPPVYGQASAPPLYGAPSAPPSYGPPGYGVPVGPPAGPRPTPAFFTGDWAGAFTAVASGVGAMLGLALVALAVANTGSGSSANGSGVIGGIFKFAALAAGGELRAEYSGGFSASGSVSFRPLTLTLVGYGLMAFLMLRRMRRSGIVTAREFGLQAGRVGVAHLGVLLVVALLSGIGSESSDGITGTAKVDVFSTLLFGTLTLAVALFVVALLGLPAVFSGQIEHYRHLVAGPVRAVFFLIVSSSVLAFVALALLAFTDSGGADAADILRSLVIIALLLLPNISGFAVLFGMGVPLNANGYASVLGESNSGDGSFSILDLTGDDGRFWAWPLIVAALLVATGVYSARRSPIAANGRPVGWWLAIVLPVALVVASMSLSLSAGIGGFGGFGAINMGGDVGFDLLFVILLGAAFGLGAGMLGSAMVPRAAPMGPVYPMTAPVPPMPAPPPTIPAPPGFVAPTPGHEPPPGYVAPPSIPPQPGPPTPPLATPFASPPPSEPTSGESGQAQ